MRGGGRYRPGRTSLPCVRRTFAGSPSFAAHGLKTYRDWISGDIAFITNCDERRLTRLPSLGLQPIMSGSGERVNNHVIDSFADPVDGCTDQLLLFEQIKMIENFL